MKQNRSKQTHVFMLVALLCVFAAIFQLQARVHLEASDKAVAVIMLQEDIACLAKESGKPLEQWYQSLSEAGLAAVILTDQQLDTPEVTQPIYEANLSVVSLGGGGHAGLYLAPVEYDIQSNSGLSGKSDVASPETGRVWIMIENHSQTGCVIPEGYHVTDCDARWAKGFYLRQNERARAAATELGDAKEVGDMLFRAVSDRGVQVLWITPLEDEEGIHAEEDTYQLLLTQLQARIERCGYHYGIPQGIEALNLPGAVLILCGIGIVAASMLLLNLLLPVGAHLNWILSALGILECIGFGIIKPQMQMLLLALAASIVFPALSVCFIAKRLSNSQSCQHASLGDYLRTVMIGALITLIGGVYIGAVLGTWQYILVLQVFRGVKLSQLAVYAFAVILLAFTLLEIRKSVRWNALIQSIDRKAMVRLISIMVIFAGVGLIYMLRGGDGMLGVSTLETRFRAALEHLVLFRPRTKEFLIAWPSISIAFCFAARKDRLLAWLFGALGSVGFASIANTFCHIRAHFLISVARTAFGLIIGLAIGSILFILFRPAKE